VLVGFSLRFALFGIEPIFPYVVFFLVTTLAGIMFRPSAGLFAIALSTAAAVYFFVEPQFSFAVEQPKDVVALALFLVISALTVWLMNALYEAYAEADAARHDAVAARARAEAGERERDLLLAEFAHRVKNDLARASGALRLQASGASPEVAEALSTAADRLRVTARVHDRLARTNGEVVVNVKDFLGDLVADLGITAAGLKPVDLLIRAECHLLPVARAGSIGLIVNELITLSLKHAFPGDRAGSITTSFSQEGATYVLRVEDDGVAISAGASDLIGPAGLGRKLLRALAAQLGGQIETAANSPSGTVHVLRFPADPPGGAEAVRPAKVIAPSEAQRTAWISACMPSAISSGT
jgi:two-component sensor histidine kinase